MKAEFKVPRPPCPYVMIAVPKEDFKRVNDLAEAYWIASDPGNKESIKQLRRNLVKKVHKPAPPPVHSGRNSDPSNSNVFRQ